MSHKLNDDKETRHMTICNSRPSRYNIDPFSHRALFHCKKLTPYYTLTRSHQCLDAYQPPRRHCKPNINKYAFRTTATPESYCAQLKEMVSQLANKERRMANRNESLLIHYNNRWQTTRTTLEIKLESLARPLHSPKLIPTD